MMKTKMWKVHAEKFAEDLWERMRRNETFDVLCDDELNDEYADDRRLFIAIVVDELGETFDVSDDVPSPTLFTAEQRAKVMEKVDLREYANTVICGDGLEIDRAVEDFAEMSDEDVVVNGVLGGVNDFGDEEQEAEVRAALADLPGEVVKAVLARLKEIE